MLKLRPTIFALFFSLTASLAQAAGLDAISTGDASAGVKEQKRAEAFLARLQALGLTNAAIDAEGNVVGVRKGTGNGPKLVISAHLDTVFPSGTDLKVKECDGKLYAPGISDNTRGLAVLLS